MKIYINEEAKDMLLVEGDVCAVCWIDASLAEEYLEEGVESRGACLETLQDNQANDSKPSYAEQIESGYLREVTMEELTALGY